MIRPTNEVTVYLYSEAVDMRKSIDGLALLVEQTLDLSPMSSALFVFCNRSRDKIKILCWERNGFIVWYKRLEKQRFRWPKSGLPGTITGQELNYLLDGFDIFNQPPHQTLTFDSVG